MSGFTIDDFRFSGSYVSRYHHCPGSAVLAESIPGFHSVVEERAASSLGTRLHKVFERILTECEDWLEASASLRLLADVWGKNRTDLLQNQQLYILWWFMELKNYCEPPIDYSIISMLHEVVPEWVEEDNDTGATTHHPEKEIVTSPKLLRFLADAIVFLYELRDENAGAVLWAEKKVVAKWTKTKPKTTADVVLSSGVRLDIVDLKTGSIPVEAAHNEQLLYYLQTYRKKEVELWIHVVQPDNVSSWQVPQDYLDEWVESVLAAEQRILDGDRSLVPGKYCQFCAANPFAKGERGTPSCPEQVDVLFGAEDLAIVLVDED
jgi:hypothetical protein